MLEGYITPLLTSYLNKYIKNLKPSDLQLSFWGGDAVLKNLELKLDAIEEALRGVVPFELKSGRVKQLTIHIPWTAIGSEAIEVTLDSVECTIKLCNLRQQLSSLTPMATPLEKTTPRVTTDQPQAPGYVRGLLSRISNNIIVRVNNLILKVIEEETDILLSISIKELYMFAADEYWKRQFIYTDQLQEAHSLQKVAVVSGATVCLDVIGNSGQVEVYDEPILSQCDFECRWMASYHGNTLVENRVEILAKEIAFSVSEQQFSSFLHLIDWFLAMYYSFKKLKGRDDQERSQDTEREASPSSSTEPTVSSSPEASIKSDDLEQTQDSWGAWFMSFVAPPSEDNNDETGLTTPPSSPSLSLGLYAQVLTIDFKVTQKRPHPVFFSSVRKSSRSVMLIEFIGCIARVDRVPTSTLLGVAVGIMSVNGWMNGVCPCNVVAMTTKKRHHDLRSEDNSVHIYSMGGCRDNIVGDALLVNSFYCKGTDVDCTSDTPSPHYWLQYKSEYSAVWFTYEYYDITNEREVEICNEEVQLGEQRVLLSADVIHRLEFYIERFLRSLDVTPLISQGVIVIGDPRAKTDLHVVSASVQICLTLNNHLLTQSGNLATADSTLPIPSVAVTIDTVDMTVAMAMYSGNATPQCHQELVVYGVVKQLKVTCYDWFRSNKTCLTGLENTGKTGLHIPTLNINVHNIIRSYTDTAANNQYMLISASEICMAFSLREICVIYTVIHSWILKDRHSEEIFLPLPLSLSSNEMIKIDHYGVNFDYSVLDGARTFSVIIKQVSACLSSPDVNVIPLLQSPAVVVSFTKVESINTIDHVTGHVTDDDNDDKAIEVHIVLPMERKTPSIQLRTGSTAGYIDPTFLKFLNNIFPLLMELHSHIKTEERNSKLFQDTLPERPDPEGLSALEILPLTPVSSSMRMKDEIKEGEEHNKELEVKKGTAMLSAMQAYNLNVFIKHIIIIVPSQTTTIPPEETTPTTPLSFLTHSVLNKDNNIVVFTLPEIKLESGHAYFYPYLVSETAGSWQISLIDATIFTVMRGGASYMLHPLSIDVSVAPIQSPSLKGVAGLGVHVDIKLLQFTVSKQQVILIEEITSSIKNVISSLTNPPLEVDNVNKPSTAPPSLASSPHLSSYIHAPSDSSISTLSINGSVPSLWLQLTLGKVVVGVVSERQCPQSDGSDLETKFVMESEEISFSFDMQEKGNNCQLKLSSMEAHEESIDTKTNRLFTKLFSSQTSVVIETVAKEIETCLGSSIETIQEHSFKAPLSPLATFLLLEVMTHSDDHRATEVKLHVQTFGVVLWLPLVTSILDIYNIICEDYDKETKKESMKIDVNSYPSLDINLHSFQVLFPSNSSALLVNIAKLSICSYLEFPISRMVVNSSAMRKLSILVSEKRAPPLPGYQLNGLSLQLLGIKGDSFRTSCFSLPINVRVLFSPALFWLPRGGPVLSSTSILEKSFVSIAAAGHSLEIHLDTEVFLLCGPDQVHCISEIVNDVKQLFQSQSNQFNKPVKLESDAVPTSFQLLFTSKAIHVTVTLELTPSLEYTASEEWRSHLEGINLSVFNPVLMATIANDVTAIDVSMFNLLAKYCKQNQFIPLLETSEGSLNEDTGLPNGLLSVKWKCHKENGHSIFVDISRSIKISCSPTLILLLFKHYKSFKDLYLCHQNTTLSSFTISDVRQDPLSPFLSNIICSLSTKQAVCIIQGNSLPTLDSAKGSDTASIGSGDVIICCESITMSLPPKNMHPQLGPSKNLLFTGSGNNDITMTQIYIEGLSLSYERHDHVTTLVPYTLVDCYLIYHLPGSQYDRGNLAIFFSSDFIKLFVGVNTMMSLLVILREYFMIINEIQELLRETEEKEDERQHKDLEALVFHDDLRSGDLVFITEDIDKLIQPSSGEVRFFTGINSSDRRHPPSMIWCYKEPRYITKIHILPIPFEITSEEDCPTDLKVICELSYFKDTVGLWIPVATLHLSETEPAEVEVESVSSFETCASVMWQLTLTALEWSEEEDGEYFIFRTELPLSDSSLSVLSPLALAGCTHVDSIFTISSLSLITLNFDIRKFDLVLRNEKFGTTKRKFKQYHVIDDFDQHQLDIFQLTAADFNGYYRVKVDSSFDINLEGSGSLSFLDMRDFVWNTALYPTQMTFQMTTNPVKQSPEIIKLQGIRNTTELNIKVSCKPVLIRLSPSFIYLINMATTIVLRQYNGILMEDTIIAPYVICNNTMMSLNIGQVSTIEGFCLPSQSCIGYSWRTYRSTKSLHLCFVGDHHWQWSSEFNIDFIGTQEVSIGLGDDSKSNICLFIETVSNGGMQKLVTIKGTLSICSYLSIPLHIKVPCLDSDLFYNNQNETQSLLEYGSESRSDLFIQHLIPAGGTLEGFVTRKDTQLNLGIQSDLTQNIVQLIFDWNITNEPNLIQIPLSDTELYHCWYSTSINSTSSICDNSNTLKIILSPLVEVHNILPFDIQIFIQMKENTSVPLTCTLLPGKGQITALSTLMENKQYLIQLSCVSDDVSHSGQIPLSTNQSDQVPVFENECSSMWPYKYCKQHYRSFGDSTQSSSEQSLFLPLKDGGVAVQLLVQRKKEGSIRILVLPEVILINDLAEDIMLQKSNGELLLLRNHDMLALTLNEDLVLTIKINGIELSTTATVNFKTYLDIVTKEQEKCKRLNLLCPYDNQCICELLLEYTLHYTCLIATLKPLFIIANRTSYCLSISPYLHNGTIVYGHMTSTITIPSNDTRPLLTWRKMEGTKLTFAIYITASNTEEVWSIPLSLRYVRCSFSLPLSSATNAACVLTTHEYENGYYVVISLDPKPRLILTNLTSTNLQIKEAHIRGIHAHPQNLYSGSEISFEPSSLAKLYPLIEDQDGRNERQPVFKTLCDVYIQLRPVLSDSQSSWSNPVKLTHDIEQNINLLEERLLFSASYQYGTCYISLLPCHGQPVSLTQSLKALPTKDFEENILFANLNIEQFVLSFDIEDCIKQHFDPVLRVTVDQLDTNLYYSAKDTRFKLKVKSVQIDNVASYFERPSSYTVVGLPRYDHNPPLQIVPSDLPPVLVVTVDWVPLGGQLFPKIHITSQPVTLQVDDVFIQQIVQLMKSYQLSLSSNIPSLAGKSQDKVPSVVLEEAERDRNSLTITVLIIDSLTIYLSAHLTQVISVSCDDSRISFSPLQFNHIYSNWIELSQSLAVHYTTSLLLQAGWLLGSLDVIGSPTLLLNNLSSGVHDFFSLPYEGLTRGPGFFILGLGRGVTSLVSSVSGGILRSVTNFASSIAANMERLSLDPEHVSYQENLRLRGQRSQYLGSGLVTGMSSFGMSVMSAVAGVVEQPMQSVHHMESEDTGYARSMLTGVGKSLLGIVTKPVGGVFQLVSQTGHDIINSVGFKRQPNLKSTILQELCLQLKKKTLQPSVDKFIRLLAEEDNVVAGPSIIKLAIHGMFKLPLGTEYEVMLVLTRDCLLAVDIDKNVSLHNFNLSEYQCSSKQAETLGDTKTSSEELKHTKATLTLEFAPHSGSSDISSSYVHVQRYLHCTKSNGSQVENNIAKEQQQLGINEVYELVIDDIYVATFLSFFSSAKIHLKNPQEYFM